MLNENQKEVVHHKGGSLVNIAGPGSGKTTTLIEKIKYIREQNDAKILEETLVLTFTNSAAVTIRDRALKQFSYTNPWSLYFGTYHATFKRILTEENIFHDLGLDISPTLTTPNEINRNLTNKIKHDIQEKFSPLTKKAIEDNMFENQGTDTKTFTTSILKRFVLDTDNLLKFIENHIHEIKAEDLDNIGSLKDLYTKLREDVLAKLFSILEEEIKDPDLNNDSSVFGPTLINVMGDNAFLHETFKVFFARSMQKFFEEKIEQKTIGFNDIILITLFALRNHPNFKNHMRSRFKHIFIDEFQDTNTLQGEILKEINNKNICVIGDPYQSIFGFIGGNIQNMLNAPEAFHADTIQLQVNYRSTENIVNLTNHLAETMREKIMGWKPSKHVNTTTNPKIKLLPYTDQDSQRKYMIEKIKQAGNSKKIAIIGRSGFDYKTEQYLNSSRLNFQKLGGLSLKESVEVQSFTTLYTYILDNNKLNALSYFLPRIVGIGDKNADTFIQDTKNKKNKKVPKKINEFFETLNSEGLLALNVRAITTNEDIMDLTFKVNKIWLEYIFPKISKSWKREKANAAKQKVNVIIDEIMEQKSTVGITTTLDNYYLDNNDKNKKHEDFNLTLSTIHSSKGLEWDIVFLVDWGDKSFKRDNLPEAQRLNYVAVSRAKTELHVLSEENLFGISEEYIQDNPGMFENASFKSSQQSQAGVFRFGKYKGKKFEEAPRSYLSWVYETSSDFFSKRLLSSRDIELLEKILYM